jgi:putative addiction module component (TIGR02574 family)
VGLTFLAGAYRCKILRMERTLEDLASEALGLSLESRAALAKRLLDSLDDLAPEEYERLWVDEAARRYQQLKAGTSKSIASEELFARLDGRLRR